MSQGSEEQGHRQIVSADSHVIEPVSLWEGLISPDFWGDIVGGFSERPGGYDPAARVGEMEVDKVSAEVLYSSLGLKCFLLESASQQRECFQRYNDWLADYCRVAPDRLVGIGLLSTYDIDAALKDVLRCSESGFRGVQIWQTPPSGLSFNSGHYEPLWEACDELGLPVSLHILSGFDFSQKAYKYGSRLREQGDEAYKVAINEKLLAVMNAVTEIIFSGAFDRYRNFKLVLVENEIGWLPFFLDQLDYYYERYSSQGYGNLERSPSSIFQDQVYVTFFRDKFLSGVTDRLGTRNLMWSSDYPHGNSTWPNSQEIIAQRMAGMDEDSISMLVRETARALYDLQLSTDTEILPQ